MTASAVSLINNTAASSVGAKVDASAASLATSEQTFLKLLTTQLKNQDPLSPLDSNQFTQQIVQMTGVEQQLYSNKLLEQLVNQNGAGLSGSVGLIGKTVAVAGDTTTVIGGKASWSYDLPKAAASTKLEIVDSAGREVWSGTAADGASGRHGFQWDGKDSSGNPVAEGGQYRLIVDAKDASGAAITATSYITGVANALESIDGQTILTVGKTRTLLSNLVGVTS